MADSDRLHPAVVGVVGDALAAFDRGFGGEPYTLIGYGSAVRGDFLPGRSDLNLLLIAESLAPERLAALAPGIARLKRAGYPPPLLWPWAEWRRAQDVFPIEITDLRVAYVVLRGEDPVHDLQVDPADLRRALEREFRGTLLRLRQAYAAAFEKEIALGALAAASAGSLAVLARCALMLRRVPLPPTTPLVLREAASHLGAPVAVWERVWHCRSERKPRLTAPQFVRYLEALAQAAAAIDAFPLSGGS